MFDLAIFYRMVGGFVGTGSTFTCRLRWSLTVGLFMTFASLVHHEGWQQYVTVFSGCTVAAYVGRLIPHAVFQAKASLWNSLGMSAVNAARLLLILIPYSLLFKPERLLLAAFGIGAGVAYYVGWTWLNNKDSGIYYRNSLEQWRIDDSPTATAVQASTPQQFHLDRCAVGGGEWGELLTGFLAYQLMYLTALVIA